MREEDEGQLVDAKGTDPRKPPSADMLNCEERLLVGLHRLRRVVGRLDTASIQIPRQEETDFALRAATFQSSFGVGSAEGSAALFVDECIRQSLLELESVRELLRGPWLP